MRFYKWVMASLAVHAAVVLLLIISVLRSEPPPKARDTRLDLELFGMLSERQVEEKSKAGSPDIPAAPLPPKPEEAPKPEATPEKPEEAPKPAPVAAEPLFEAATETPAPEPAPAVEIPVPSPVTGTVVETAAGAPGGSGVFLPSAAAGGGGSGGSDAVDQRGETTRRGRGGAADPLSLYTARVARRLNENLIYPEKMRRRGIEAVTTIVFTVEASGKIKKDSLKVRKGSGYGELDENALKAARQSAPFDRPPKEMTLVIELAFEVERRRG